MEESDKLTPVEAAKFLSKTLGIPITRDTIYTWFRQKKIPGKRIVGRIFFERIELENWCKSQD